ncbi:hypothetical protein DWX43_23125 [Clostridium sp. AF19-22AC]|jgi:hypothetical protein|uniref:hypothetical protein n=1 Tax=Clostridia TaxID=186801 RepID=UPI000E521505|nr:MULTISPECIES: hypothetical protein [Clostridia]RHR21907.1 hypothetical protein DWX43_23125 [Clostridium sp. AF19-22AC]
MKRKQSLCKLLAYEFKIGSKLTIYRYIFTSILLMFIIGLLIYHAHQTGRHLQFWDMYTELWEGVPIYIKGRTSEFKLPVLIVFTQTLMLFLVGSYPRREMQGYGKYEFLYTSRRKWWFSKCVWVSSNILLFYVLLMLILAILVLVQEKNIIFLSLDSSSIFITADRNRVQMLLNVVLLPFLVSETLGMIQTFIGIFLKPIYGYVISEAIIIVSAYKLNPLLIGNYMMMLRNRFFVPESNIGLREGVITCLGVYIFLFYIGCILIRKADILAKGNELD